MLEKYRLMRTALKKGLSKEMLNRDMVEAVVDFGDLELICLCTKIIDDSKIVDIDLLINAVYKNARRDNLYLVDNFISIMSHKKDFIQRVFSMDINNLKKLRYNLETYALSRESSIGL